MENVIMMINNARMSFNFALAQKENKSFKTCKNQSKSLNKYTRFISYHCYSKRFIEVFNATLWKILLPLQ